MTVDYLSCGTCFISFRLSDISLFIEHKKANCSSSPYKQTTLDYCRTLDDLDSCSLECVQCFKKFSTPWNFLMHVQFEHQLIFANALEKYKGDPVNSEVFSSGRLNPLETPTQFCISDSSDVVSNVNVATQTNLSSIKKRIVPHRKRKYFNCCAANEPALCRSRAKVSWADHKDEQAACCDMPTVSVCPCDPTEPSPVTSALCVCNCYCSGSVICQESTCASSVNESSKASAFKAAVVGCCLLDNSCCTVSNLTLPLCCTRTNKIDPLIPVQKVTCCPCSPTKPVKNMSAEVQTEFDPEFSYSDYADLALFLASPDQGSCLNQPDFLPLDYSASTKKLDRGTNKNMADITSEENHVNQTSITCADSHQNTIDNDIPNPDVNPALSTSREVPLMLFSVYPNIQLQSENIISCSQGSAQTGKQIYQDSIIRSSNTSQKRFVCEICGIPFRQNVHLRKHVMMQHTKQKPYRCSFCDYTTVERSHLTVHVRTHTGERPFSCRECGYSSAQNCTLKSHYLRKHPKSTILCSLCFEPFFTELELSKHRRICRTCRQEVPQSST